MADNKRKKRGDVSIIGKVHEVKNIHKDKSIFVFSGDDEKGAIIVVDTLKLNGNVIIKDKNVHIIKGDEGSIFEIKGKHEDGKVIIDGKSVIWNHDDKNIWTIDKDKNFTIRSLGKGNTKFFISGDSDKEPLFILDGKKVSKKVIDELDSDQIEKIEVLKGDSATKEYGKKAKDGVVVITTKKKE